MQYDYSYISKLLASFLMFLFLIIDLILLLLLETLAALSNFGSQEFLAPLDVLGT